MVVAASLLALAGTALMATESAADKSFTLSMQEPQRTTWNKGFNKLVAEPFKAIRCAEDAKLDVPAGEGCVDAGDVEICCKSWSLRLECKSDGRWEQTSIEGASCDKRPTPKKN
jgi:hypothetical protein